ncbi:MAG: hypothetical protein WA947_08240 [Phormidesmis sp.]
MLHLALLKQLIAFDGEIYRARRSARYRILLLTSEAIGQCLLKRAIAIAKRNIDYLGNVCEPTLISQVRHEIIFSNGSLIQYASERSLHNLQKYHTVFWQPPTREQLAAKPELWATLPANILAPGGELVRVDEAIAQFYSTHP